MVGRTSPLNSTNNASGVQPVGADLNLIRLVEILRRQQAFNLSFREACHHFRVSVAQLDRVSASEAEGCGFDPRPGH
jgi:hypothetical protein